MSDYKIEFSLEMATSKVSSSGPPDSSQEILIIDTWPIFTESQSPGATSSFDALPDRWIFSRPFSGSSFELLAPFPSFLEPPDYDRRS